MPALVTFRRELPPSPPGGRPECGESTAVGRNEGRSDDPPELGSRGRRFGPDLLWQTRWNHSTRSIGRGTGRAPTRTDAAPSHRVCRPDVRPVRGTRIGPSVEGRSLGLVSHLETT